MRYDPESCVTITEGDEGYYFTKDRVFQVMSYASGGAGKGKPLNEDGALIDPAHSAIAVADGVGGNRFGEKASRAVIQTVREGVCKLWNVMQIITESRNLIYASLLHYARGNPASTLAMARLFRGKDKKRYLETCVVGDSKVMVVHRRRGLIYASKEQTEIGKESFVDPVHWYTSPYSHIVSSVISHDFFKLPPEQHVMPAPKGAYVLAMSDGVTGFVSEEEIVDLVRRYGRNAPVEIRALAESRYYIEDGFMMCLDGEERHVKVFGGDHLSIAMMCVL